MKVSPLFFFMIERNKQYTISFSFVTDYAIGHIWDNSKTFVGTLCIPREDLDIHFAASPERGFPKVIDRDGYAVLYNDRDGYEAWELTFFDLNKNPIVVPIIGPLRW